MVEATVESIGETAIPTVKLIDGQTEEGGV
jgi:hypothetical protein